MPLTELISTDPTALLKLLYWKLIDPIFANPTLSWMWGLSTLLVVYLFFLYRASPSDRRSFKAFWRYTFPRSVWGHPSAIADYKFFVVNQFVLTYIRFGQWVVGLVGILQVAEIIKWGLDAAFGAAPASSSPSLPIAVLFTLTTALAFDYGRFLSHYVQHRVPLLWEFHKVHHSAEVLTPFSSFRAHPVDQAIEFLFRLITTAGVSGVFAHFFPSGISELTILNYSALTFFFYITAHLRHSHVPLGFGKLSTTFVSPVMHQLHHSAESKHFDKNFGFIFAWWDRMYGTLYLPVRDEQFRLGLPEEAGKYDTVMKLMFRPFIEAGRLLVGSRLSHRLRW